MIKIAINLYGLQTWFGGDYRAALELIRLADRKGIYQVSLGDHVIMGEDTSAYPFGQFSSPIEFPWMEPITLLAAVAATTERIRLSTGVLLSPLRPAVLLAKQLASLDVLSHGRVDIGVGTGWQRAEYDASGVPFDSRAEHMYEQIRVCRQLWGAAPASFSGDFVAFERLHSQPQPIQGAGLPVLFGVPPSTRNFDRIAELGDGWLPLGLSCEQTAAGVERLCAAFSARGRDPAGLTVRHILLPDYRPDAPADIAAAWKAAPGWRAAGVNLFELFPTMFCRGPEDFEPFIDRALALAATSH